MESLPEGVHPWSVNKSVAKIQRQNLLNAAFFTVGGFFGILIGFKLLEILGISHIVTRLAIAIAISITLWKHYLKTTRTSELLSMVAIGNGHPWYPSEEVGDSSVWVSDGDKYHKIPEGARLYASADPLLVRTLLKRDDSDGKTILIWPYSLDNQVKRMVALINQSLALRDAQNRDSDAVDTIENARERESQKFYPVEREWMDTTEGTLTPKPGILLRGGSKSEEKDSSSELRDIINRDE